MSTEEEVGESTPPVYIKDLLEEDDSKEVEEEEEEEEEEVSFLLTFSSLAP